MILRAILARAIEPGLRVETIMLTTNVTVRRALGSEGFLPAPGRELPDVLIGMEDGTTASSWLGLRNVDGKWLVREMTGYPIEVFQAGQAAKHK